MPEKTPRKRDVLRDRVVDLVVKYANEEGGMSQSDLEEVLGRSFSHSVTSALLKIPTEFSHYRKISASEAIPATSQSKKDILRDRIIELVEEVINKEGGMSKLDLKFLFYEGSVAAALFKIPTKFLSVS